jgi:hypothetical protein
MNDSVQDCRYVLMMATYSRQDSHFLDWRLAAIVTRSEYEEAKKHASANAVIYGVPVGANYDDFKNNIQQMSTSVAKSLTESEINNVLWTGLDPSVAAIYSRCIDGIQGVTGLSLRVDAATDRDITLFLRWTPQADQPSTIPITWEGLSVPSSKHLPKTVTQGSGILIIVDRPKAEQELGVKWKGEGRHVTLTPLPETPPPAPTPTPIKPTPKVIAAISFTSSRNVKPSTDSRFGLMS